MRCTARPRSGLQRRLGRLRVRSEGRARHGRRARSPHGWVYGVLRNAPGVGRDVADADCV